MSSTSQVTTLADKAYIYGLSDPRTDELRYVGKSKNWKRRSYWHVCASSLHKNTYKNNWIKSLLSLGLKPRAFLIEEIDAREWEDKERKWIAHFRAIGTRLTNATSGGDGAHDLPPEVRKKMGDALRGRKKVFTKEHKDKIAAANRLRTASAAWKANQSVVMRGNQNGLGKTKPASACAILSALRKKEFSAMSNDDRTTFAMRGVAGRLAKLPRELSCAVCWSTFFARDKKAKHCSGKCKQAWHRAMEAIYVLN